MYIKKCRFCDYQIEVKRDNNSIISLHENRCNNNPNRINTFLKNKLIIIRNCIKCNKQFKISGTQKQLDSPKSKKCCSRFCANSRNHSNETKNKISESMIGLKSPIKGLYRINRIERKCIICNNIMLLRPKNPKKYHKKCYNIIAGGLRKGSGRGKKGWYKGYWCDSSWELAFVIYNLDHNIKFERNKEGFEYEYKNKKLKFYPDFILEDGSYVEIKGYKSDNSNAKLKAFPFKINFLYKNEMKKYLDYAKNKFGNKFIQAYENEN